jgi:ABC-type molybdate transport system substrate-binding protein
MQGTKNRQAAERFLAFLQSQTARDVMARHGFLPAGGTAPR